MASSAKGTPRRTDARRNREAILVAARELFARSGEVPMYEIARRAGVGQATLYRHFPDRGSVAAAIFAAELDGLERLAVEHAGDPAAFFVLMRAVAEVQTRFYGLVAYMSDEGESGFGADADQLKERFTSLIAGPLRDAKSAGLLRRTVELEDVFLLIAMVGGALDMGAGSGQAASIAARAQTLLREGIETGSGEA